MMNDKNSRSARALISIFFLLVISFGCSETSDNKFIIPKYQDFNNGWLFLEGDASGAEHPGYDDSGWRRVDLPHDWGTEDYKIQDSLRPSPFLKNQEMGDDVGYLRGGTGWYRKTFIQKTSDGGKLVFLHFDGVQSEMKLWVNGQFVGEHVYGYTPFYFEITHWLHESGTPNHIAIRVNNPGKNSRWYNGSGIYRQVYISEVNPQYLEIWGTYITTLQIVDSVADISIETKYNFKSAPSSDITLRAEILSPSGETVALEEQDLPAGGEPGGSVRFVVPIDRPGLWDPEHPVLYVARLTLVQGGETLDQICTNFGIRTIQYSADRGFLLNGKEVLLKGACMHHDNGLLGAATFKRAEERRVRIMRENGYNAIRTSHNPPSEAFLDACDRLGMLVIDESFDMWEQAKRPNDYHLHFDEWWKKDLEAMLLRDRNHPSVIMWSFGNEVKERADSSGLELAGEMIGLIRSLDPSRPVTQAICGFWDNPGKKWDDSAPAFELLDIGGYNYQWQNYESDHQKYPARIMFGSESVPREAFENWELVKAHPYVIGDFVWTGFDYIGESGIGHAVYEKDPGGRGTFLMPWPWYVSWCGDIDITGHKKPQSLYRDVVWGESNLEILVHEPVPERTFETVSFWGWPLELKSWNWEVPDGTPLQVNVYSSYPAVRLELNGNVVGEQKLQTSSRLTATFEVPYKKGELRAIGMREGKDMEMESLVTTGPVAGLQLVPERLVISASRSEIAYMALIATDLEGHPVPVADLPVSIEVEGRGELLAAGNGSPVLQGSFRDHVLNLYRGRALVIVRSTGDPGKITVRVTCSEKDIGTSTTITAQ
jgi:beta-galactosidase